MIRLVCVQPAQDGVMKTPTVKSLIQECRELWDEFVNAEEESAEELRINAELVNKESELEDYIGAVYDTVCNMKKNNYEDYKINAFLRTEFGLPAEDSY